MRGGPAVKVRLAVLLLALGCLLGAPCDGGEQKTWVALVTDAETVGTFSPLVVHILVSSPTPIQAFELGLRWDPSKIHAMNVAPHPEFDDDGVLFTNPRWDVPAGRLDRIVDLRHGGEGAQGTFRVATVQFLALGSPGSTSIQPTSRGLADGNGNETPVSFAPLTLTIEP